MRLLKLIRAFIQKWIQSWKTKPDFILNKKPVLTKQVSKKFSFLNALISGSLGVRTLLSILVGIAGISSIVVYDTVVNFESPMFVSSSVSDSETDNNDLLTEMSYLLSQPEPVSELPTTETVVETVPEINAADTVNVVEDDGVITETSPPTGRKDIAGLFVLTGVSYISAAVIFKLKKLLKF